MPTLHADRAAGQCTKWLKEKPYFSTEPPPATQRWTGFLLHWVHRGLAEKYQRMIADLHLSPVQIEILQLLTDDGVLRQREIVARTRLDKGAISIELANLREQGLVERSPLLQDRRSMTIALSEKGRLRIQQTEQRHEQLTRHVFGCLSAAENRTLHHLLAKLGDRLDSI